MASRDDIAIEITPEVLLKAYACGIFPMAESADDPALYWIEPQARGILPLDDVHVMITAGMSPFLYQRLQRGGIKGFVTDESDPDKAVQMLIDKVVQS